MRPRITTRKKCTLTLFDVVMMNGDLYCGATRWLYPLGLSHSARMNRLPVLRHQIRHLASQWFPPMTCNAVGSVV